MGFFYVVLWCSIAIDNQRDNADLCPDVFQDGISERSSNEQTPARGKIKGHGGRGNVAGKKNLRRTK